MQESPNNGKPRSKTVRFIGAGVAGGIIIGVVVGFAFDNVALGIAFGLIFGPGAWGGLDAILGRNKKSGSD